MDEVKQSRQCFHRGAQVTLRGRYMLQDGREFACRTVDISAEAIAILGATRGEIGERVVAYLDELGRIEGTIVRHFGECFTIEPQVSAIKREWLNFAIGRLVKEHGTRAARRGFAQEVDAAA